MDIIQKDKIVLMDIGEIKEYKNNPRKHPPEQLKKIATSIREYGFDQPIVVDDKNVVIKGHGRLRACRDILHLKKVPVIVRGDLTPAQIKASRLADNRVSITTWEIDKLGVELTDLNKLDFDLSVTGFDPNEIKAFNLDVGKRVNDPYNEYSDMPEYEDSDESGFRTLLIHFKDQAGIDDFSELVKQKITDKTKYLWYPPVEKENAVDYRVVEKK